MLTVTPPNATVASGIQVVLMCTTESIGTVAYTFLHNSVLLATSAGSNNKHTLTSSVSPGEIDDYSCIATMKGVNSSLSNVHSVKVVGE